MQTYLLYLHDRRYSVPTLEAITVSGEERALELVFERLHSSPHYLAAELWDDDRLVGRVDKPVQEVLSPA